MVIKKNNTRFNKKNITIDFISSEKIYFQNNAATFLNHSARVSNKNCWNDCSQEKLWLYNLHYFDGLKSKDAEQSSIAYQLLERWIKENPPFIGIGWESFPISLRIVNIVKYALSGNAISEEISASLYLQARYLNKKCEYHLLGNHLFENFKALCVAGLFFDTDESKRWLQKALRGLKKEIHEQVLNDGGHFELSPMYHCLFLEGLLDLKNIFNHYQKEFIWKNEVENMLSWLHAMKRSHQEISYFNDAANDIAVTPEQLILYANQLGLCDRSQNKPLTLLSDSGYFVVTTERFKIICDVGNIGPDYLPAHAHADTLSFECMVDHLPVFVNLGTSCYGNLDQRIFERSTSAHNTVCINQQNSSEVWGGFRVGKRARIKDVVVSENKTECIIRAVHDGYSHFKKNMLHERTWQVSENKIEIIDRINQLVDNVFAYFHLHPNCKIIHIESKKIIVQLKNNIEIPLEIQNDFFIIENYYAKTFGDLQKTKSIKIKLNNDMTSRLIMCIK